MRAGERGTRTEQADERRPDDAAEDAPEGSGLRIAALEEGGEAALSLELVPTPAEGDQVVEGDGTRVFLEPEAATLLEDKVLDVERHDDHYHFNLSRQGTERDDGAVPG